MMKMTRTILVITEEVTSMIVEEMRGTERNVVRITGNTYLMPDPIRKYEIKKLRCSEKK